MRDHDKQKKEKKTKTIVFGTSPISSRGQLVIPAKLRKAQNLQPGDTLIFTGIPGTNYFTVLNANAFESFTKSLQDLFEESDLVKKKK